ncbi:DUF6790 family protein [Rhodococcus sp. UNC23MFCrub1.1]|uniref:DUF6790 family protein n=1 Tax=Rhodococcus sp. UNC23MFCrub1.1 TaxID=1449068 RepID=UPI000690E7D1|nr:DUF6790 family protein [Rhodococcus sp. UNC23MFCrub1.1]
MWSDAWNSAPDYGPVAVPLISVIGAVVSIRRHRGDPAAPSPGDTLLLWLLVGVAGVGGLVVTGSHVFAADATAEQIGFPAGNPFQFEVAMANLAFAVLGLLCATRKGSFRTATAIGFSVFYLGDAVGHFVELVRNDNYAPYNSGPILIVDVAVPVLVLLALSAAHRHRTRQPIRTDHETTVDPNGAAAQQEMR